MTANRHQPYKCRGVNIARAIQAQKLLARKVVTRDLGGEVRRVAGVDVSYPCEKKALACLVVYDLELGRATEASCALCEVRVPYIPGLLAFRELKPMLMAVREAGSFDAIIVNGCGVNHPRRLGLASHLGIVAGVRSIGVTRRSLIKEGILEERSGYVVRVVDGEAVEAILRAKTGGRLVVGVGHGFSLETAVSVVRELLGWRRFPLPLAEAHMLSSKMARLLRAEASLADRKSDLHLSNSPLM